MSDPLWTLPGSWSWMRFADVADVELDLVDAKEHPTAVHIAPNHIESGTGRLIEAGTIAGDKMAGPKHVFRKGHILYSKIRPYLAKATLAEVDGLCSSDIYPVSARVEPGYLLRWLVSPAFTQVVAQNQGRTVLPKVNLVTLNEMPVPVPPPAEQHRIVAKLDDLLARSRRAKVALDAIPPLLDKLRQSILAAAFRGDLTADWRAKHPDREPAEKLLARIRVERQKKWEEAELAKMRAKGKMPGDDRWKDKYEEPAPVDTEGLPELPEGWCWASLSEVAFLQLGQRRAPEYAHAPIFPYVRAANITWRGLDLSDVKSMGFAEPDQVRLHPGDVILSEASGSPTEVGKPALWRGEISGCCFQATVLRVRSASTELLSEWFYHGFLHDAMSGNFAAMAPGVGILHLTAERMRGWPVPIAPINEQREIVRTLQAALEKTYRQEDIMRSLRERASQVDSATLSKAFRGDLVPQDPQDEPAADFLARLRNTKNQNQKSSDPDPAPKLPRRRKGKTPA